MLNGLKGLLKASSYKFFIIKCMDKSMQLSVHNSVQTSNLVDEGSEKLSKTTILGNLIPGQNMPSTSALNCCNLHGNHGNSAGQL